MLAENQYQYHYSVSASMNVLVPVRLPLLNKLKDYKDDDDDGDNYEEDGEMLPPHEMVAHQIANFPLLSSSVLGGAGKTVKGRDLRQVRNAHFPKLVFID